MNHPPRRGGALLAAALPLSFFAFAALGCSPQQQAADSGGTTPTVTEASPAAAEAPPSGEMGPPVPPPGPPAPAAPAKMDTRAFKGNGKPVTTKTGLKYEDMTVGTGKEATMADTVLVHYTGTLTNGTKFDSSRDRGEPTSFPLTGVVPGFGEGIAGMKVGGRRKLTIPPDLGYGAAGNGPVPANATLIFDVELMDVQ